MALARAYAVRHGISLGRAVSDLVRAGADRPLVTAPRSGLHVARLDERSPKVTAALVDRLREDEG